MDDQESKLIEAALQQEFGSEDQSTVQTRQAARRRVPFSLDGYDGFEELHRGGQGVVYQAVQKSTKRKVAIKLLLEGPHASDTARKRFEREVELVAQLKHPHIITVFDSGVTPQGHHYFVMDYVRGLPLDQFVRENRLPLRETLELFSKICKAVNYAHQKGVIHRDLKPPNILVLSDRMPKVLDFGLAKPVSGSAGTLVSVTGQVVGTLPYLSPEQAKGNPDEIDIRTDVYALGVILYEVLTGKYPYPVVGPMVDVLRHIAETSPTPPSLAWKPESGLVEPSGRRRSSRPACPIGDELQTIILKVLAKEPPRRYQSAGELAADIDRYLAGETIEAKRDRGWYVLRKAVSRYRAPLAVGIAFIAIIVSALFFMSKQQAKLADSQRERDQVEANTIMAAFVHDPDQAIARYQVAKPRVKENLVALSETGVSSSAFTERIAGARSGILVNPTAFWKSADGGPLWQNGEWLEICSMPPGDREQILDALSAKAQDGTDRQKYVAFCLIGQLAGTGSELADLCRKSVDSEAHPGVVAAARWAAGRMGKAQSFRQSDDLFVDALSGLAFMRVPQTQSFYRGSDADDPDRYPNEAKPKQGVVIRSFYMSSTEVTMKAFAPFATDPSNADLFSLSEKNQPVTAERLQFSLLYEQLKASSDRTGALSAAPVGWMNLTTVRRYCNWLNERAKHDSVVRRYRLPSEDEWEYACRAGNQGRFCFGNDARYATYFANCQGKSQTHRTGQAMPNFYGLFDMHGGLWEWCDTRFPPEWIDDPVRKEMELYVKRGGAFYSPAVRCRSAQRNYIQATAMDEYTGFRLVMERAEP